ncbi:MAG: hypothetical protein LBV04_08580 [Deferribacteraceae bacterium]|jgi:multimeric flavodoxin WrbA|nr:hypothetical protein [Deferribacteraceae bacterium]
MDSLRLLIYDSYLTPLSIFESVACQKELLPCNSCFACWVKTPGRCIKRDIYTLVATKISRSHELHIISKCFWGGYSPAVQNVLDRSIGYLHPFITTIDGEMYYRKRYPHTFTLTVNFYGNNITKAEERTAKDVANSSAAIFHARGCVVNFFKTEHEANEHYGVPI